MNIYKLRASGVWLLLFSICYCTSQAFAQRPADTTLVLPTTGSMPAPFFQVAKERDVMPPSTINGRILEKTPVANITNTLYGRLPGLTVRQGSGEPGYDNAALFIRGRGSFDNAGLIIYVDGFQVSSSYFQYLSPSEIESISVLKDPVSLATFGMRGANGVLWIVSKRGSPGRPKVQAQLQSGMQSAIDINKPYRSFDYARLYNQAVSNDNYSLNAYKFNWTPAYSEAQLNDYRNGTGADVDWYGEALRKNSPYTNANVLLTGGDTVTRYSVVLDYMNQGGLYDIKSNDFQSNAEIDRFNIRSNLDFRFFKIFEAKVDLGGRIEDRRYPNYNGGSLWADMGNYPANIYPIKDVTGNWSGTSLFPNNPIASLNALGWTSTHDRTLQANFNLKERLDFVTPGLYLRQAVSFNTWTRTNSSKTATYARFFNGAKTTTDLTTDIVSNATSPVNQYDWKQINLGAGYDRTFGGHAVTAAINYWGSDYTIDQGQNTAGQNTGLNIFYHNYNIGGRLNYAYDKRYILDLGFGWSGSDNYAPGNRWGFYPAAGAGWVISNESFLSDNKMITFLKLRASAGKSGNDQTFSGRFLYQQYFISSGTYYTGNNSLTGIGGIVPNYAANPDILAEESMKYNAGLDLTILNRISLSGDVFLDKRSGIVVQNNELSALYGAALPYANLGKVTNKGFELVVNYLAKAGPVAVDAGAMAAYARNTIDYQAEIPPVNSFSSTTGLPIAAQMGLVADGLFDIADFNENGTLKAGIPVPNFGAVQPGDIRYKDLDNNGLVNQNDITKVGNSNLPTLTYSFNLGLRYKNFDFYTLFQGVSGNDIDILSAARGQVVAFVNNANIYPIAGNAWAYYPDQGIDTRAAADYPRLTTKGNENNYRSSSFWIKDGSFLRLRNVELGYSFPAGLLRKAHVEKLRVHISAVNPVTWSSLSKNFNIDPETTTGYPGLKSFNAGVSLTF
ncbi:TonB-linked SusC/RagA family outer membrane protein [Arcticibacter tournemirensis]|uniref:SusC/RagA family TonB-linked outer membrane protein n=1 Tax=Arcticibacter tournemirensis TaxID=699437 RepID=A0A5M9GSF7_9SPHI|nr:SusC/RagA family TonB-linked outer membrane protein [Arcticibacter tournemirensis]KAA8477496.1 SusC/RagA family TonB-linked outer membrane protein [Arcticibacter tournemirensis]TQM51325.1 TonB-linked SusC/RagA family outer membrane protein [Arcticibacter tournemirensis]